MRSAGPVTQRGLLQRGFNSLLAKSQRAKVEKSLESMLQSVLIVSLRKSLFIFQISALFLKQPLFPQHIRKHKLGS